MAAFLSGATAGAQEPPKTPNADDKVAAQALYDEGKKLKADDHWEKACDKFAESQRLDPQVGTQGSLADCYEHIGRTASAWSNWTDVATLSSRQTGDVARRREEVAREHAAALLPKLSRLKIKVTERVPGLEIKRSGQPLRDAQWDLAVPVDPLKYEIVASAPSRATWKKTVEVPPDGASVELVVPKLAVVETPPPVPTGPPPSDGTAQVAAGGVLTGLGVVGLGLGTAFGVMAMGKKDDSLDFCRTDAPNKCSQEGVDLRQQAITFGNVSTAGIVVGGAAFVVGLITIFTAPSAPDEPEGELPPSAGPTARLDVGPTGLSVTGVW
ncbi:MAG: hypothetical protein IT373_01025 [Polyangiaceae bacterium]|nr:hypothetical protein [Polyangiaceae bacterium]